MKPPKHLPKPARKTGGARATNLSDQMAIPTVEIAASQAAHFDNYSVEQFAYAMRIKLAVKRNEGRGGWQDKEQCSNEYLSRLLREHVEKGDPVDVANFCMMLHQRGERIATLATEMAEYVVWSNEHKCWWGANRAGYVSRLEEAGRYTRDEALKICVNARGGRQFNSNPSEVPLPLADAALFWPDDKEEWRVARNKNDNAAWEDEE